MYSVGHYNESFIQILHIGSCETSDCKHDDCWFDFNSGKLIMLLWQVKVPY